MRVRLATITEVECRKAVHGKKRQTGIRDWLSGPALWLRLTVAHGAVVLTGLCGGSWGVRGRGFIYASRVSALGNDGRVTGGTGSVGLVAMSALAVGRRLQIVLWKERANQDNQSISCQEIYTQAQGQSSFDAVTSRSQSCSWLCTISLLCDKDSAVFALAAASTASKKTSAFCSKWQVTNALEGRTTHGSEYGSKMWKIKLDQRWRGGRANM